MNPTQLSDLLNLWPVLLVGLGGGWVFAFITRWTPFLRWPTMLLIGYIVFKSPRILDIYQGAFWPLLGYVLGIMGWYLRQSRSQNGAGNLPRTLARAIIAPFRYVFVTIPVLLIRLAFWLKNTIPLLVTPAGWKTLIAGLGSWLYHLIPQPIRAEWEFQTGSGRQQRQPKEPRPRSSWGRKPKEEQKTQSESFWEQERRRAAEDRTRHSGANPKNSQSKTSSPPPKQEPPPPPKREQKSTSGSQGQKQEKTTSSTNSGKKQSPPKEEKSPPPPKPEVAPGFPAYAELHRAEFEVAGWPFDPLEQNVIPGSSAYSILGLSPNATKEDIKRTHRKIARTYLPFTNPYHPISVQKHANAFMACVNDAKDRFFARK